MSNGRKIFNFAIEIDGLVQVLCQEVKMPVVEVGAVSHGVGNYDVKTAGGVGVEDAVIKKIKFSPGSDGWAWDWMMASVNGIPIQYKKNVIFRELAEDGITTLNAWLWEGAWCRKVAPNDYKRGNQNENVIEECTISVDKVTKIF